MQGGEALVTYNPDNCSKVWIKEQDGSFTEFCLIENRFSGMPLDTATDVKEQQKKLVKDAIRDSYQAKINLMSFVETVARNALFRENQRRKNGGSSAKVFYAIKQRDGRKPVPLF